MNVNDKEFTYFESQYIGSFPERVDISASLDKAEITDLLNMMFRFQLRTGSPFKVEEFPDQVVILTDLPKLQSSDVLSFFKRNRYICGKISFFQIPPYKKITNIYEDCGKKGRRKMIVSPYPRDCPIDRIVHRTSSISFILDS